MRAIPVHHEIADRGGLRRILQGGGAGIEIFDVGRRTRGVVDRLGALPFHGGEIAGAVRLLQHRGVDLSGPQRVGELGEPEIDRLHIGDGKAGRPEIAQHGGLLGGADIDADPLALEVFERLDLRARRRGDQIARAGGDDRADDDDAGSGEVREDRGTSPTAPICAAPARIASRRNGPLLKLA